MSKSFLFIPFLLMSFCSLAGQQISVKATNTPINEVIYSLIDKYKLQMSFNERQLSQVRISMDKQFSGPEEALSAMLQNTAFEYRKEGDVFIILKKMIKRYILSGRVGDKFTGESLPFAHVIINGVGLVTDQLGKFLLECNKQENEVRISYIGYYLVDTILFSGSHSIKLTPAINGLQEITIEGVMPQKSMEIGNSPGIIRLNQKTARRMPGYGDNAVFNYLRLQPGILAAGEQSKDLIIWGSYEGQSKVMFDGFTVYGLKNFNDNISAVNPYMSKDMLVLKGGYGAEYGGRVGGIVDITGITGNKSSPAINLNINNMTMSGMASVPVSENSVLSLAYRRTYYNLYDAEDLALPRISKGRNSNADITIVPDYTFGDFNMKYAGNSLKTGTYFVSLYQGKDNFSYNLNQERNLVTIQQDLDESNKQRGGALQWGRDILNRFSTDFTLAFSDLGTEISLNQDIQRIRSGDQVFSRDKYTGNRISDLNFLNRYYVTTGYQNRHQLQAGFGYEYNKVELLSQVDNEDQINTINRSGRLIAYLSDKLFLGKLLEIKSGIRFDLPGNIRKAFFQPRISVILKPGRQINTYIAWGVYNQFISRTSIFDDYGNYQYFWAISDNIDVPVLGASHYVAGTSYHNNVLTLSAEGYYKTTDGLSRYVNLIRSDIISVFQGDSKAFGLDFLIKGLYKKQEAWISYSLSKTLEYFSYFPLDNYRYAPQDQRHEIKTAFLLNFNPIYFSANYVYGSGLILQNTLIGDAEPVRYPYSRLDLAIFYGISIKGYKFEIGASVMNALNTENVKYANFVRVPSDQLSAININAEAVPFTPAIFLNLAF